VTPPPPPPAARENIVELSLFAFRFEVAGALMGNSGSGLVGSSKGDGASSPDAANARRGLTIIVALHARQRTEKDLSGARPSATRYRVWQLSQKMSMCGHGRCNNHVGVGHGWDADFLEK
jgi:hypothetical protein